MSTEATLDRGLSTQRLSDALAPFTAGAEVTSAERVPVGTGQMADCFRIQLRYASECNGPSTIIAKVPSLNQSSRAASRLTRCYELETQFYSELRARVDVRAPLCYHSSYTADSDEFLLLLEDLAPAVQGDQLKGCSFDQALAAVGELTRLHGPLWNSAFLNSMSWLGRPTIDSSNATTALFQHFYPGFVARYSDQLSSDVLELGARFVSQANRYFAAAPAISTVVHRDFRLDNLLFNGIGNDIAVAVVDWQTVCQAPGVSDLSYFVGSGLAVDDRRRHEEYLVREYQRGLQTYRIELKFDELWNQYRLFAFSGFGMAIAASMLVKQTDRGDEMFVAMASRHGQQAIDLESELLF
ncbi:MAG: phosphotransferase [Ilumatobacteraceae bacterium]